LGIISSVDELNLARSDIFNGQRSVFWLDTVFVFQFDMMNEMFALEPDAEVARIS